MFGFSKKTFGLDISDDSIEIMELSSLDKISSFGRIELPLGVVEDARILKEEVLIKAIQSLIDKVKPKKLSTRRVVMAIPESKVFSSFFRLPLSLKNNEIKGILENEAESKLPVKKSEVYTDFLVTSTSKGKQEIFFAAVLRETVNNYCKLLEKLKLTPFVFEMESFAQARAILKDGIANNNAFLILDIGARKTVLSIFNNNIIRVSAVLPRGGNNFTNQIAQKLNLTKEEAENLKQKEGLKNQKITSSLSGLLDEITDFTLENLKFFQNRNGIDLTKVLITGGSAQMEGLRDYFSRKIEIIVEIIPKSFYSTAQGLAMRGLDKKFDQQSLNFLP